MIIITNRFFIRDPTEHIFWHQLSVTWPHLTWNYVDTHRTRWRFFLPFTWRQTGSEEWYIYPFTLTHFYNNKHIVQLYILADIFSSLYIYIRPPWSPIMLNIGWGCYKHISGAKGLLGSVPMVYHFLHYPLRFHSASYSPTLYLPSPCIPYPSSYPHPPPC